MSVTITLPADLAARIAAEATRRGVSVDELVVEALDAALPTGTPQRSPKRRLAFGGIGASTSGRTAAEAEEMLAEGFGRDSLGEERP